MTGYAYEQGSNADIAECPRRCWIAHVGAVITALLVATLLLPASPATASTTSTAPNSTHNNQSRVLAGLAIEPLPLPHSPEYASHTNTYSNNSTTTSAHSQASLNNIAYSGFRLSNPYHVFLAASSMRNSPSSQTETIDNIPGTADSALENATEYLTDTYTDYHNLVLCQTVFTPVPVVGAVEDTKNCIPIINNTDNQLLLCVALIYMPAPPAAAMRVCIPIIYNMLRELCETAVGEGSEGPKYNTKPSNLAKSIAGLENGYRAVKSTIENTKPGLQDWLHEITFGRVPRSRADDYKSSYPYTNPHYLDYYMDVDQCIMDFLGILPLVGFVFDLSNAIVSILRTRYADTALSLFSALPVLGMTKGGHKVVKQHITNFVKWAKPSEKLAMLIPLKKLLAKIPVIQNYISIGGKYAVRGAKGTWVIVNIADNGAIELIEYTCITDPKYQEDEDKDRNGRSKIRRALKLDKLQRRLGGIELHVGHLQPRRCGGKANSLNTVIQTSQTNTSRIKIVENLIADFAESGSEVKATIRVIHNTDMPKAFKYSFKVKDKTGKVRSFGPFLISNKDKLAPAWLTEELDKIRKLLDKGEPIRDHLTPEVMMFLFGADTAAGIIGSGTVDALMEAFEYKDVLAMSAPEQLPSPPSLNLKDYFIDDNDHTYESSINFIARYGVTVGCNKEGNHYCPDTFITRAQMASFLARAMNLKPPTDPNQAAFSDIADNIHEDNIRAVAHLGITAGCNKDGTLYCPDDPMTQAQLAIFLARAVITKIPIDTIQINNIVTEILDVLYNLYNTAITTCPENSTDTYNCHHNTTASRVAAAVIMHKGISTLSILDILLDLPIVNKL